MDVKDGFNFRIWLNEGVGTTMQLAYADRMKGAYTPEGAAELVYRRFKTDPPHGYHWRTLGIGDIVTIDNDAFMCLCRGWFKLATDKTVSSDEAMLDILSANERQ